MLAITFDDVLAAADRLRGVATRTPVVTSRTLDAMVGRGTRVYLKCESFQRGGAFKFRGAYNRLAALTSAERARGVVAFSSGNHAQGVALAARELGVRAVILMPTDAPRTKVAATAGYGAEIIRYDRHSEDREALARGLAEERGMTVVPSYDDPYIMAGQGTAALELVDEVGPLDLLLAPLGGGGLLSGCATAVKGRSPDVRVIGVETETANDWVLSLQCGERVRIPPPDTIADGIRLQEPGKLTFPVVRQLAEATTVSDDEVKAAMAFLVLRLKLVVEPTGAVPVALLLSSRLHGLDNARVGVIISGGNVDPDVLCDVLAASD
jgi:threonine dehydratase